MPERDAGQTPDQGAKGGTIVRNTVRKLMGVAVIGLIGAFVATPMLAAGAQTIPGEGAPPSPGDCTFSVDSSAFPQIAVTGTTPAADVQLEVSFLADGTNTQKIVAAEHLPNGGDFSLSFNTGGAAGGVSVNYTYGNKNAYVTGCTGPGGVVVVRVENASKAASKLAFTGSSNTMSYVLVGIAAVVLGMIFVIAARRRSQVNS